MKRLSCEVKGQIDACEGLLEAWVARLAECRLEQKAGYDQHASLYNRMPSKLEQNTPEPQVKAYIPLYEPLQVSRCERCETAIDEPRELIRKSRHSS